VRHLTLPYRYPLTIHFSPCGRRLYAGGIGVLAGWDLDRAGGKPAWVTEDGGFATRLAVSPCGRYVAGADDRCVLVWDLVRPGRAKWLAANRSGDHITDVAFTPDGSDLLTACIDGARGVRRWRVGTWRRLPAVGLKSWCDGALAVSPDGKTVATSDAARGRLAIKLWRYPGGTLRKTAATDARIDRLLYSPDGSLLAAQDDWRRVRVWDARTLREVARYEPPAKKVRGKEGEVTSLAFHPSGRVLAVASDAAAVAFLDTVTWRPLRAFDWRIGRVFGVTFSPDGALCAATGVKGRVVVWDVDD